MRKKLIFIMAIVFTLTMLRSNNPIFAATKNVSVGLPDFKVTLNGKEINNLYSKYPLIVYKDITYFPMTYAGCRYLGLETKWDEKSGLEINKTNVSYPYESYKSNSKNSSIYKAAEPIFNVKINGKVINNNSQVYPLLSFRDVTYFPLTWDYGVNEFGWDYHFDNKNGLVINSQNAVPKEIELQDYLSEGMYHGVGQFIIKENYMYYAGNNGAIYKSPLDNLKSYKKIFETPLDYFFSDEKTYGYPYFDESDGNIFFTYHIGGGSVGSTYKVFINEDDTTTKPVRIGPLIGSPSPDKNGLLLNWSTIYENGNYSSSRAYNHETEHYDYMICTNELVPLELSKIYKRNKTTDEVTLVSDKPTGEFKYRNERLYFVSNDYKLYSLSLNDESVNLESNGPIRVSGRDYYQVLGDDIYYINNEDGKIYKEGTKNPINLGDKGESILVAGDYAVLKFESTLSSSYRTVIYDKAGNEIFKLPRYMNMVYSDLTRLAYFDEDANRIFLVELN